MNIYKSVKGFLCAEINGKNIHSQYNPEREAIRFVQASILKNPSIIILLGAGLGYILEELIKNNSKAEIIAVYYDDLIYENRQCKDPRIKCWFPSCKIPVNAYFSKNISESQLRNLAVLEWNPSSLIFPSFSLEINKQLKITIQQLNGNIKTTAVFGKKWIRNMICNYLSIDTYCSIKKNSAPIVIVSSGPTLEQSLAQIRKYKDKIMIWALPSSLEALNKAGIKPDLLISTDPGYYGRVHFNYLPKETPVALPLTASRGLWAGGNPVVILNQSLPFENDLFRISELENINIPSNGTVSGTALELALRSSDNIYFAGLDLCFRDIQSHIRPHSFDNLLQSGTFRSIPLHTVFFHRAATAEPDFLKGIRTSRSLETYKNWFNSKKTESEKKIKRLNPSPVHLDNIREGDLSELRDFPDIDKSVLLKFNADTKHTRKRMIQDLLSDWEAGLIGKRRDDLLYFIDTDTYTKSIRSTAAITFISELRRLYV
jgi:hypothetical protein